MRNPSAVRIAAARGDEDLPFATFRRGGVAQFAQARREVVGCGQGPPGTGAAGALGAVMPPEDKDAAVFGHC
jgi:hypothetical protein